MNKIFKFIALICLLSSCNDFLDEKSNNRLAVPVTIDDLQALLDNQTFINTLRTPSILQSSADDTFLLEQNYDGLSAENKLFYAWKPFDYFYSNDWSAAYQVIYTANYCLETLGNIPKNVQNRQAWENVYGSACFLKSYYYLGLLWAFSKEYDPKGNNDSRGIVLRSDSDFNVPSIFFTVGECYDEVISLAEESLGYLPETPLVKARPSKLAAHSLLARALLSMGMYEDALAHAEHALAIDDSLIDFNNADDGINIDAPTPFTKFTKETIFYSEMTQKFTLHRASTALIDTVLFQLFEDGDLRRRAYYQPSGKYHKFKGTHSHSIQWLFSGLTTAELYLIRAECRARNSELQAAMNDLNRLLKSRWDASIPYLEKIGGSKESVLKMVLDERRKELAMRGIRWSDIKRLNREGHEIQLTRKVGDETFVLQPQSEGFILPLPRDLDNFL